MMKLLYFAIPMLISAVLVLAVRALAVHFGLYAKENSRTVHHDHPIPRLGGIGIFAAFIIGLLIFVKDLQPIQAVVIGAAMIFAEGLYDDLFDMPPLGKLLFQIAAAAVVIYGGHLALQTINLPFGIHFQFEFISVLITFLWIVGITNAINLIDGLDGLAGGISVIVLLTISFLTTLNGRPEVMTICLILAGSTMGFLFFNFHPASIFMGDCGSQVLGFMIAAISLQGFKSGTFITLGIPITLLFIPIADTLSAIVRRRLKGEKFTVPDKNHIHHKLMQRLGHTGAVITLYVVTALFGLTSYLYIVNEPLGMALLIVLIIIFEIFIEYTELISPHYRPILGLFDIIRRKAQSHDLPADGSDDKTH